MIVLIGKIAGGGLLALLLFALLWFVSALWWGFIFMLVAGALGHSFPYWPTSVWIGALLSLVLG